MNDSDYVKSDYDKSKEIYQKIIDKGMEALDLAMRVAEESEHPRSIEVLATLIKNVADTNDKIMDLNKKRRDMEGPKRPELKSNNSTHQYLFTGKTSEEIQKMLLDNLSNDEDVIDIE